MTVVEQPAHRARARGATGGRPVATRMPLWDSGELHGLGTRRALDQAWQDHQVASSTQRVTYDARELPTPLQPIDRPPPAALRFRDHSPVAQLVERVAVNH